MYIWNLKNKPKHLTITCVSAENICKFFKYLFLYILSVFGTFQLNISVLCGYVVGTKIRQEVEK